jgi:predicted nicotinamide N-methyase
LTSKLLTASLVCDVNVLRLATKNGAVAIANAAAAAVMMIQSTVTAPVSSLAKDLINGYPIFSLFRPRNQR